MRKMKARRRPPPPTRSKTSAQRAHSLRRAGERYDLTTADVLSIERMIQQGDSELIFRQSNRVTHHAVAYKGQTVRVVYDHQRRQAATFLPAEEAAA